MGVYGDGFDPVSKMLYSQCCGIETFPCTCIAVLKVLIMNNFSDVNCLLAKCCVHAFYHCDITDYTYKCIRDNNYCCDCCNYDCYSVVMYI